MNIEDELRGALDVSVPPPTTTLDHVLKRGRRRVFAQRAGALLGVVVVVAGIGFGATTLNTAEPPSPADEPDHGPAVFVHELGWPRVNLPRRELADPANPELGCGISGQPSSVGRERLSDDKMRGWRTRVQAVVPDASVDSSLVEDVVNVFEVGISDRDGAGSVRLATGSFGGGPLAAADEAVWATGSCEPPQRTTGPDGTVYQLYDVRPNVPYDGIVQTLYVFRPDGKAFRVEQLNSGANSTGSTRPGLPLTQEQFASLGPAIAEVA
jgi:hypothetical protein